MADTRPRELTAHELRRVSVKAYCDPRTVRAYLAGESQNGNMVARIERALHACGFPTHVRRHPDSVRPPDAESRASTNGTPAHRPSEGPPRFRPTVAQRFRS